MNDNNNSREDDLRDLINEMNDKVVINRPSYESSSRRGGSSQALAELVSENKLINFEDVSGDSLDKLPTNIHDDGRFYVNDKYQAAASFLANFNATVTIRDPKTKMPTKRTAHYYNDVIRLFSQKDIKIIDINYIHFVDWIDSYVAKLSNVCKKYSFEFPVIDISKLDQYEINDLCICMYSKYLLNALDKDKVEEFQAVMKEALLDVYKNHFDKDIELNLSKSKTPEVTKAFLDIHIGVVNFPVERDIYDIRSEMLNRACVIKGDLDSYDDKTRFEIIKSSWRCEACLATITMFGSNKPTKCVSKECGEKNAFKDLAIYTGVDYVYMKISQHVHTEDTLIGMSDIVVRVEGPNLIKNFWKKSRQSATLKVTGIAKLSPDKLNRNNPNERNIQLNALSIEVEGESTTVQYNEKLMDMIGNKINLNKINAHYDKLKRSICPHLYKMEPIKEAVLLMLGGAVARLDSSTKRRLRGDLVGMLLGDSSMGKSEFGVFICKVNPYAIRTVGGSKTTTAAALTSSWEMIKDVKVISKGVLPRCDLKGFAIIDELDKRNPEDMQVLSIPLDDNQVIPTHKSNYHHDIPARCPVLLIGNATKNHGKWDPSKNIISQTNYGNWLIARADLIFILIDDGDMEQKKQMVEHMAKSRKTMVSEYDYNKNYKNKIYSEVLIEKIEQDFIKDNYDGIYDTEFLRHWFHYCKQNYKPTIKSGSDVEERLKKEYLKFSQITTITDDGDESGPYSQSIMDARAYNGLERVAMSIARQHMHHFVTMDDMEKAINLMMSSVSTMLLKPKNDMDKLSDGNMSVYKQFNKLFKSKDGFKNYLDQDNAGWEAKRRDIEKKYRQKLNKFNLCLFKRGFINCDDCHGKGVVSIETAVGVQSETCLNCKGNKVFNRKFTYLDIESDMNRQKIMGVHQVKNWFKLYSDKKLVVNSGGSTWKVGLSTVDSIMMNDIAEELAERFARGEIEKEKGYIEDNLSKE